MKAASETHADVGDKANDAVRVNGGDLRAQVVGEGGNLGFTQRGRIEFALGGGQVNTDAIDNAGGVNCSDHEVNIKVLLDTVVADGDMTVQAAQRAAGRDDRRRRRARAARLVHADAGARASPAPRRPRCSTCTTG